MVLRPTRHKTGHFGDVSSLVGTEKTKYNTTKARTNATKRQVLQNKINTKKLKPGLVAFYDIGPGNGACLFSEGHIQFTVAEINATVKHKVAGCLSEIVIFCIIKPLSYSKQLTQCQHNVVSTAMLLCLELANTLHIHFVAC